MFTSDEKERGFHRNVAVFLQRSDLEAAVTSDALLTKNLFNFCFIVCDYEVSLKKKESY